MVGAVARLKSYGFLTTDTHTHAFGVAYYNMPGERVLITDYGRRFCEFCLKS